MDTRLTLRGLGIMLLFTLFAGSSMANGGVGCDQIVGTWISEQRNFVVQVYKEGDTFKASVLWFDDSDDKSRPMDTRLDDHNPDKTLRMRKVLGMSVLRNLEYNAKTNTWENGVIYDAKNGKEWTSCAALQDDGTLKVTGYWHFKFIGKSIKFKRLSSSDRMLTAR